MLEAAGQQVPRDLSPPNHFREGSSKPTLPLERFGSGRNREASAERPACHACPPIAGIAMLTGRCPVLTPVSDRDPVFLGSRGSHRCPFLSCFLVLRAWDSDSPCPPSPAARTPSPPPRPDAPHPHAPLAAAGGAAGVSGFACCCFPQNGRGSRTRVRAGNHRCDALLVRVTAGPTRSAGPGVGVCLRVV